MSAEGNVPLYEGQFLYEHGDIKVEQIEDEDKTSVRILRNPENIPSTELSGSESEEPLDIVPIISSPLPPATSSSVSSISDSDEITVKKEKLDKDPSIFQKETHDIESQTEVFRDEEILQSKEFRNIHHKWDDNKVNMTKMSEFLDIFMNRIIGVNNETGNFMDIFGSLCDISSNNGLIYAKSAEKMLSKLFENDGRFSDIENLFYKNLIFTLLQDFRYSDFQFLLHVIPDIFNTNFTNIMSKKTDKKWYIPLKSVITSQSLFESGNIQFIQFVSDYMLYVIQCINHLLINRKINTHHITERYIMECVFAVIKIMIFPNNGSQFTSCSLYDFIKARDFEIEFLGRNVWLRQVWSLFVSVVYTETKLQIYPKKEGEGKITYKDLLTAYSATVSYYDSQIMNRKDKIEKLYKGRPILSKIVNEYENVISVMNMALYCFKFFAIIKQGRDYDVYHKITHAAWFFPRYRGDIEQCEISENLKTTINALNWKSLYEDSKHLHSFRATRTFGTPLPEKYWRAYDPQDVAACIKSDSLLQQVCINVANHFGLYESCNADLLQSQEKVNQLKELLYIKVSGLKKLIASERERYLKFVSNGDIPDFDSRIKIFELMENDTEKTVENLKWVKINMDNPKSVFLRLDQDIVDEQTSSNISLIKYDKTNKIQIRKMIALDQLKTDIKIAQSLLRYFEQMFDAYFVEARDFL